MSRAGATLATVDAYWEAFGVVLEIDSVEWHLSPEDYRRTQRRHAWLGRHGLQVIPFGPADVEADPELLVNTIRDTLAASTGPAVNVRIAERESSPAA
jgi:very-short-patch-repair endonuclease